MSANLIDRFCQDPRFNTNPGMKIGMVTSQEVMKKLEVVVETKGRKKIN